MPDNDVTRMTISDGGVRRAVLEVANNGQVVAVYDTVTACCCFRGISRSGFGGRFGSAG